MHLLFHEALKPEKFNFKHNKKEKIASDRVKWQLSFSVPVLVRTPCKKAFVK